MKEYKICSNCVMDTSDNAIQFDKNGVCDHCNTYYKVTLPSWNTGSKGWEKLQESVEKIKIEGKSLVN